MTEGLYPGRGRFAKFKVSGFNMRKIWGVILIAVFSLPLSVYAQNSTGLSSGAILERSKQLREFYLMEKRLEEKQAAPGDSADGVRVGVSVSGIAVAVLAPGVSVGVAVGSGVPGP